MSHLRLLFLGFCACNGGVRGPDPIEDEDTSEGDMDADDDGYVQADDCDDSDPRINPSMEERCDGGHVDEDCDGAIDDADTGDRRGAVTSWRDRDADGFGESAGIVHTCVIPTGNAEVPGDCDDTRADVSPAGTEVCDGNSIDEDCDGLVNDDDDTLDAAALPVWYADADGDGFGDASNGVSACVPGPSQVADATDCDDADREVNPSVDEVCDNGRDDNCDGDAGECGLATTNMLGGSTTLAKLTGEGTYDLVSWSNGLAPGGDLNGDGYADVVFASYMANGPTVRNTGAVYAFYGPVTGDHSGSDANARVTGDADSDLLGSAVLGDVDLDHDGYDDLAVGAMAWSGTYAHTGGVWIFAGSRSGPRGELVVDDADWWWQGTGTDTYVGESIAAGDVNADGNDDLLIGAEGLESVYVFRGPINTGAQRLRDAALTLSGDGVGSVVATGDLDGDGTDDIVVAAPDADPINYDEGVVYVVLGDQVGALDLADDAEAVIVGESYAAHAGISVAADGDLDGDGTADLVIGADYDDAGGERAGAAFVFSEMPTGSVELATSTVPVKLTGTAVGDYAGYSVASPGDVSGDGVDDLVVGVFARDSAGSDSGSALLFFGGSALASGTVLDLADGELMGDDPGDQAGHRVSRAGDVNGDGTNDLLVAAPFDDDGGYNAGAVYVVAGGAL